MGAFIVFEGGEGSGKSTQARVLFRRLQREGYRVMLTHEPGGTPLGEAARRWLKSRRGTEALAELFLFMAARAQLVRQVLRPALERGEVVVCDRFGASTVAYQGYGRGLDLELIHQLNRWATGGLFPDLTVLLDVPVEVGMGRKAKPGNDVFEGAGLEFHRRVREGYLAQARQEAQRWLVVDGARPRREVAEEVWQRVEPLVKGTRQ